MIHTFGKIKIDRFQMANSNKPVITEYAGHVRQTSADVWQRAQTFV